MTTSDIDPDVRLRLIREICAKEGHGELLEWTRMNEPSRRFECRRGCGVAILEFGRAVPLEDLPRILEAAKFSGSVQIRGTVEVTPQ